MHVFRIPSERVKLDVSRKACARSVICGISATPLFPGFIAAMTRAWCLPNVNCSRRRSKGCASNMGVTIWLQPIWLQLFVEGDMTIVAVSQCRSLAVSQTHGKFDGSGQEEQRFSAPYRFTNHNGSSHAEPLPIILIRRHQTVHRKKKKKSNVLVRETRPSVTKVLTMSRPCLDHRSIPRIGF